MHENISDALVVAHTICWYNAPRKSAVYKRKAKAGIFFFRRDKMFQMKPGVVVFPHQLVRKGFMC